MDRTTFLAQLAAPLLAQAWQATPDAGIVHEHLDSPTGRLYTYVQGAEDLVVTSKQSNRDEPSDRLFRAVKMDSRAGVLDALASGAKADARGFAGETPLHAGVDSGASPEVLEILLRAGAKANARDAHGSTPLHIAAKHAEDPRVISMLIEHGADVHARDSLLKSSRGETPLRRAVQAGAPTAILDALVKAGANVNERGRDGLTPLEAAVTFEYATPDGIEFLARSGAKIDATDPYGWTLLHRAVAYQASPEIIIALLKMGFAVNAPDPNGFLPLHIALGDFDQPEAAEHEQLDLPPDWGYRSAEIIEVLIRAGADVHAKSPSDHTPLHWVAQAVIVEIDVLAILLAAGADVHAAGPLGKTALHLASEHNRDATALERLVSAGADVNVRDDGGATPLHLAGERNDSKDVLQALISYGANPRATDKTGKTPHATARHEHRDMLWKAMMDKPLS